MIFSVAVKVPWIQSKLAVVEVDKEYQYYEANQYFIKKGMELEIRKNHLGHSKWLVSQKLPDKRLKPLLGKPRVYYADKETKPRYLVE